MDNSRNLDQLATALCAAQSEFAAVPKDADNPFFRSRYASLATVVKTTTPVLAQHGLCVSQTIGYRDGSDTLTTVLLHVSGEYLRDTMRLHLAKDDPQGQGSAVTYAKRYAYQAILGVICDEDDDGNAASPKVAQPQAALGSITKRRAPSASQAAETPPEARISAADAKRELIDHAVSLGWDPTDAKSRAKEAWGDQGTEGLLRGLLETLKMQIEKAPGQ